MPLVKLTDRDDPSTRLGSSQQVIESKHIDTAVKNTFINRTAISPDTYGDIFGAILTYPEGVEVTVEYYKRRIPYINKQTGDHSFSLERAAVHSSYDLIKQLQFRIKDELNIEIDPNSTETKIDGECIMYPGLSPNVGDIFYLNLPDDNIGVFIVDLVTPLSIRKGTNYLINFHLYAFLDDTIHDKLESSVVDVLYFDKQKYFDENVTLLSDDSYHQLVKLKNTRSKLINLMMSQFHDTYEKTLIRSDTLYDPYLVKFMTDKVSVHDTKRDICQIAPTYLDIFPNTIWSALIDNSLTHLDITSHRYVKYNFYLWDVTISNLDEQPIVFLHGEDFKEKEDRIQDIGFADRSVTDKYLSYHFSSNLYYALIHAFETSPITNISDHLGDIDSDTRYTNHLYDTAYSLVTKQYEPLEYFYTCGITLGSNNDIGLSEFEYLIYDKLINDNVDIPFLVDDVLSTFPFTHLTDNDKFYYIPVLIHLSDVAIRRLT